MKTTTGREGARSVRGFAWGALLTGAACLAACGGGGGAAGGAPQGTGAHVPPVALHVVTASLPDAYVRDAYDKALTAAGGTPPYTWSQGVPGRMPAGLVLSPTGRLYGVPLAEGPSAFTVTVRDSATPPATDSRTLTLAVLGFGPRVEGLHHGDAWSGESYGLSAPAAGTTVTFALVSNASGGRVDRVDPAAGTAVYTAGPSLGVDVVEARSARGEVGRVEISVEHDPVAGHAARFRATDVWYVRFDGKQDPSHDYDSDFHAGLAATGLRGALSYEAGTDADGLAEALVRKEMLQALCVWYGNGPDGTPYVGGLPISFPFFEPRSPYVSPSDGGVVRGQPDVFNVISVIAGGADGVIGTAFMDGSTNGHLENDTTSSSTSSLGVFEDEILRYFYWIYGNTTLPATPVGPDDEPALRSLLYGRSVSGARAREIQRIARGVGRVLGLVAAHEIGHSLGLSHSDAAQAGSIMCPRLDLSADAPYAFLPEDLDRLHGALPGTGRNAAGATASSTAPAAAAAIACCCR